MVELSATSTIQALNAKATLPRRRAVACLGDSISAQNTDAVGAIVQRKYGIGYMTWAEVLSGRTFNFDQSLNFGVAGDTSAMILARVGAVIAVAPGACVVLSGVNDIVGGLNFTQTTANLAATWAALTAAGIVVVAVPLIPVAALGGSAITNTQIRALNRINNWIKANAVETPGVILADASENLMDYATGMNIGGSVGATTNHSYDGLHPQVRGAFWIGQAVANALTYVFPTRLRDVMLSPLDIYVSLDNPTGSRDSASILTGATGGTPGTGTTGVVPSGMLLGRGQGSVAAVAGSFVTSPLPNGQNLNKYRMVVTAPAGGTNDSIVLANSKAFAPGDVAYASCDVDVSGITADSLRGVRLSVFNSGQVYYAGVCEPRSNSAMPNASWSGTFRTPNLVVPAGTTSLNWNLEVSLFGNVPSASAIVDISRFKFATV